MPPVTDEPTAMENFSIALSKAVSNHKEVRDFLKTEALKCFDNDYDILYQSIKDCEVVDLGTFRDIIENCLGSSYKMEQIESALPTLTIYIADNAWLDPDGFCANNWNTEDCRAAVTYTQNNGLCKNLYSNGYYLGEIEEGTIPGGAVLIVKKNERVIASPATKSGEISYNFIDDVFDASKNEIATKNNWYSGNYSSSWVEGQNPEDNSDIMSAADLNRLNPDIIKAYNMFEDDPYAVPNDYIYYGMTPNSHEGRLKNNVMSRLIRFKIEPKQFNYIFDDEYGEGERHKDTNFTDYFKTDDNGHGVGAQPSISTIYSKLWADGAIEIAIRVFLGDGKGGVTHSETVYAVKARDLFTVKNRVIKKEQWWSTPFKWYISWRYSIIGRDENTLVEKWYYPKYPIELPTWDFNINSAYSITVSELDPGTTITREIGCITKKAISVSPKVSLDQEVSIEIAKITGKRELGWSLSDEIVNSSSTKVSWVSGNDLLTTRTISYSDKYIEKAASASSYYVYSVGDENFRFTILPCRY